MVSIIIRILGNALALYAAVWLVPGVEVLGGIEQYILAGVVLGLLNTTVRPVLKVLSMPLIILTLGLFAIVINALMLWATDYLVDFVVIQDITALVWATIIISIVNVIVSIFAKIVD